MQWWLFDWNTCHIICAHLSGKIVCRFEGIQYNYACVYLAKSTNFGIAWMYDILPYWWLVERGWRVGIIHPLATCLSGKAESVYCIFLLLLTCGEASWSTDALTNLGPNVVLVLVTFKSEIFYGAGSETSDSDKDKQFWWSNMATDVNFGIMIIRIIPIFRLKQGPLRRRRSIRWVSHLVSVRSSI